MAMESIPAIERYQALRKARANVAKRSLFGCVTAEDRRRTKLAIKQQSELLSEQSKQKWNFDFDKEEPTVEGNWNWEKVEAPASYSPRIPITTCAFVPLHRRNNRQNINENCEMSTDISDMLDADSARHDSGVFSDCASDEETTGPVSSSPRPVAGKRKLTIPDYFKQKKFRTSSGRVKRLH